LSQLRRVDVDMGRGLEPDLDADSLAGDAADDRSHVVDRVVDETAARINRLSARDRVQLTNQFAGMEPRLVSFAKSSAGLVVQGGRLLGELDAEEHGRHHVARIVRPMRRDEARAVGRCAPGARRVGVREFLISSAAMPDGTTHRAAASSIRLVFSLEPTVSNDPGTICHSFEVLADSLPHIVWTADASGCHNYANARWAQYTGCAPESRDCASWLLALHPDDRDHASARWAQALRAGGGYEAEYRLRAHDGTYRWHQSRAEPQRDGQGNIVRWIGTCTDVDDLRRVSEHVAARRELEASVDHQAQMLAAVQEAVIATDTAGRITSWNAFAETLYGWTATEAVGRSLLELAFPPEEHEEVQQSMRELRRGATIVSERSVRRKDGSPIWIAIRAAPILDRDGLVVQFVGTSVDITERRRLEEQFRQSQKMEAIGRLAGGVAHDFNNLLTVIKAHGEFLSQSLVGRDLEDIEQITMAADRAARLTRQLLVFSRKHRLEKRAIDPNVIVSELEKMLARLIGEDIDLGISLSPDVPIVFADAGQLEQAIVNLVVNARDAMPTGGRLRLRTARVVVAANGVGVGVAASVPPGEYAAISVEDSGTGMSAAVRSRIFEPFFTTKAPGYGTGLGLATVYGFVTQSDGDIDVQTREGRGSTFTILLPASKSLPRGVVDESKHSPRGGRETVLIVEDQPEVREAARRILAAAGYTVLEASDGLEALEIVVSGKHPIDVLLTDAIMPRLSGADLIRSLRPTRPALPVVVVSGYTDNTFVWHGAEDPGALFLQKPFRVETLLHAVRTALDHGTQRRAAAGVG
jgi:PAS domain S-box-containing protein